MKPTIYFDGFHLSGIVFILRMFAQFKNRFNYRVLVNPLSPDIYTNWIANGITAISSIPKENIDVLVLASAWHRTNEKFVTHLPALNRGAIVLFVDQPFPVIEQAQRNLLGSKFYGKVNLCEFSRSNSMFRTRTGDSLFTFTPTSYLRRPVTERNNGITVPSRPAMAFFEAVLKTKFLAVNIISHDAFLLNNLTNICVYPAMLATSVVFQDLPTIATSEAPPKYMVLQLLKEFASAINSIPIQNCFLQQQLSFEKMKRRTFSLLQTYSAFLKDYKNPFNRSSFLTSLIFLYNYLLTMGNASGLEMEITNLVYTRLKGLLNADVLDDVLVNEDMLTKRE